MNAALPRNGVVPPAAALPRATSAPPGGVPTPADRPPAQVQPERPFADVLKQRRSEQPTRRSEPQAAPSRDEPGSATAAAANEPGDGEDALPALPATGSKGSSPTRPRIRLAVPTAPRTAAPSADAERQREPARVFDRMQEPAAITMPVAAASLPVPADATTDHAGGDEAASVATAAQRASSEPATAIAAASSETSPVPETPTAAARDDAAASIAAAVAPLSPNAATSAASAVPAPLTLSTPLASPDFGADFGVQVSLLAQGGVQQAELHLNPSEMGPVSIRIDLTGTEARIDFGADIAATRQAIEDGLPALAAALSDAGFTLAGGGVSAHAGGHRGDARDGGDGGDSEGSFGAGRARRARLDGSIEGTASRLAGRTRTGGIDLYV